MAGQVPVYIDDGTQAMLDSERALERQKRYRVVFKRADGIPSICGVQATSQEDALYILSRASGRTKLLRVEFRKLFKLERS